MNQKISIVTLLTVFLMSSCNSAASIPTAVSQPVILATLTENIPTASPTLEPPTETAILSTAIPVSIESTPTITSSFPLGFEIPVFPGAQDVTYNFLVQMDKPGNTLYYSVAGTSNEIQAFYMDQLTQDGWEWVYTDTDESGLVPFPFPMWVMEFKKEQHKLGIGAVGFGDQGSITVLAGVDFSGGNLISNFIGMIAGGLDLMGPFESKAGPEAMRFSSVLLEFTHPAEWLVTDQPMQIFETDSAVNYMPNAHSCSVDMVPCFVNFSASPSMHFDIPISIRVHPKLANRSLEEANILRWEELQSLASAPVKCCFFPEHFALAGSLESLEEHNVTLADGTPAFQRVYRWKQEDVQESIIGTYTLFMSAGTLVEIHSDFISADWKEIRATVDQVIGTMKIK